MSVFFFSVAQLDGQLVSLSKYSGMPLLIVNTASHCGFTGMNLQVLSDAHRTFAPAGFSVLAFPCSQFAAQEPLNACQLENWRQQQMLPFPVFGKIDVKGPKASPLFAMLQQQLGPAKWNFTKFLTDRHGKPVMALSPGEPLSKIEAAIQSVMP